LSKPFSSPAMNSVQCRINHVLCQHWDKGKDLAELLTRAATTVCNILIGSGSTWEFRRWQCAYAFV